MSYSTTNHPGETLSGDKSGNPWTREPTSLPSHSAFAIGLAALLATVAVGFLAYQRSRDVIRDAVANKNLALGQTVCNVALRGPDRSSDAELERSALAEKREVIERLAGAWAQTRSPYDETYMCVIGPTGRLELHTLRPEMAGTDVSGVIISPQTQETVMQLLVAGRSWSGQNTSGWGSRQLVGYHYEPAIDSLVAVHVPASVVDAQFREAVAPWLYSMILIGGVLLPSSLCLLYFRLRHAVLDAKRASHALCLSEERHRGFAENSSEGIYLCEFDQPMPIDLPEDEQVTRLASDCHFAFCNDSFARMYGYDSGKKMLGMRAIELYDTHDNETNIAFLRQMVRNNYRVSGLVSEEFDREGNRVILSNNCLGMIEDGHLVRVWGTQRDITQQQLTDRLIQSQNAILEAIARGDRHDDILRRIINLIETRSPGLYASICILDEEGGFVHHAVSTRLPKEFVASLSPTAVAPSACWCGTALGGEGVFVDDVASDAVSEECRELLAQDHFKACWSTPIKDRDDKVLGTLNVCSRRAGPCADHDDRLIDIANQLASVTISRQRNENALRESEARFRTVFEQAAVGVALIDSTSGEIRQVNRRYGDILDMAAESLVGKTWMELTHPDDLAADLRQMKQMCAGTIREFSIEKRLQRHDDAIIWINLTVSPMWRHGEAPSTHIAIVEDITARKQAEEARDRADHEIRHHREMLAHVSRLNTMGELVTGLAHKVTQPLYAIANFTTAASVLIRNLQQAESGSSPSLEELGEWNDGAREASNRASEIIQRLRDFARKGEGRRESVDINRIVLDSIALVAFEARRSNVQVRTDLDDSLPELPADRIQCEQVFVNLLQNAYDALTEIEDQRRVVVQTRRIGQFVQVSVEDNGPGIPPDEYGKIFDAFFTTKPTGLGMGLAISRTIVEDHAGRLSASNDQPMGATFQITLPLQVNQDSSSTESVNMDCRTEDRGRAPAEAPQTIRGTS